MAERFFTRAEAEAKVGKKIRTLVEFSGVPKGTTGQVVRVDLMGKTKSAFGVASEVYDVVIQWELTIEPTEVTRGETDGEPFIFIRRSGPREDWFTREEYERFLVEEE
jgi:hypothetical protein